LQRHAELQLLAESEENAEEMATCLKRAAILRHVQWIHKYPCMDRAIMMGFFSLHRYDEALDCAHNFLKMNPPSKRAREVNML